MRYALLLALIVACGGNRAVPRHVPSALGSVPVILVPDLHDADGTPLFGAVDFEQRIIRLRASLSPPAMRQALGHERCHLALWDAHARLDVEEAEERVCDAWGTAQLNGW